ncbi:MAG TPA: hypothetical protein EYN43_12635 [Gammaproteobacteria bacterium]|nr:hypothetical protein [Gammaproteobacteria bacterium]
MDNQRLVILRRDHLQCFFDHGHDARIDAVHFGVKLETDNPIARIKSIAVSGCKPETMGLGPIFASRKALARAELSADAIDVVEINEAFATQSIASVRDLDLDIDKVNIDGGAIAIGHPLGATGARITGKAAQILKREGGRYALSTQCIGGGQGIATVMETVGV